VFGRATSVLRRIRNRTCLLLEDVGSRCILRRSGRLEVVSDLGHRIIEERRTVGVEDGCLEAHLWW
jgi:hypothetical protein